MKTKCLLYCTKAKPYLYKEYDDNGGLSENGTYKEYAGYGVSNTKIEELNFHLLNGHIVAECEVECEEIKYHPYECTFYTNTVDTIICSSIPVSSFEKASCLSYFELDEYLNNYETDKAVGYALHISNLKVFDKPLELNEFNKADKCTYGYFNTGLALRKAPQNMCYVWHDGELKVLISIQSNWLCKILNGDKTIEVRKKVLREMIK